MKKLQEKPAADDYDRTVNELFFESKAKASNRLQTEEELIRNEKSKLEQLEVCHVLKLKILVVGYLFYFSCVLIQVTIFPPIKLFVEYFM